MKERTEQRPFPEEFVNYFQGLSKDELRTRPHAQRFYHDVLLPALRTRELDIAALKELIAEYQGGKKERAFDLVTLQGLAYIDLTSRRNSKYSLSKRSDPQGFEAAKRADALITQLWEREEGQDLQA